MTSNYIRMSSGCIRGSYVDLPVRRLARGMFVWLSATSSNLYAGLQELEIFVDGKHVWERLDPLFNVIILTLINIIYKRSQKVGKVNNLDVSNGRFYKLPYIGFYSSYTRKKSYFYSYC